MANSSKYNKRYREKHKKAGLCVDCSSPAKKGSVRCGRHRERDLKSKKPGYCRDCGKKSPRYSRCNSCREKLRVDYKRRVREGQCVGCKNEATAGAFCFRHWLKNIGNSYGLNWKNGGLGMIQQLWDEQAGRCAVTGAELLPGHNASLDHIVPVSKGGPSVKSNLRWTLLEINRAKMDLTHDQFVEMCRVVVATEDAKPDQSIHLKVVGG